MNRKEGLARTRIVSTEMATAWLASPYPAPLAVELHRVSPSARLRLPRPCRRILTTVRTSPHGQRLSRSMNQKAVLLLIPTVWTGMGMESPVSRFLARLVAANLHRVSPAAPIQRSHPSRRTLTTVRTSPHGRRPSHSMSLREAHSRTHIVWTETGTGWPASLCRVRLAAKRHRIGLPAPLQRPHPSRRILTIAQTSPHGRRLSHSTSLRVALGQTRTDWTETGTGWPASLCRALLAAELHRIGLPAPLQRPHPSRRILITVRTSKRGPRRRNSMSLRAGLAPTRIVLMETGME